MTSGFAKFGLPCALILAGSGALSAQPPQGPMFVIHQEIVKPSMVAAYEAQSREFVAFLQAHRALLPTLSYSAIMGQDFKYTFVAPIKSMAALDDINREFAALAQAGGAQFADLMARNSETIDHYDEWVATLATDVSYAPASPRIAPAEIGFYHYDFYYLKAGKEMEAMAVARDFKALFASKGIRNSYQIFMAVTGSELPLLVVQVGAKSPADYEAANAADQAALGDAAMALNARAMGITRRFESKGAWPRPDLSLPPMMALVK